MRAWRVAPGIRDRRSASAAGGRREIVDEMIDDYVSWREASAAVVVSYRNWTSSDRRDEKLAFSVYGAALDREEQAAAAYQRAVAQVATALAGRQNSPDYQEDGRRVSSPVTATMQSSSSSSWIADR
jgi:hypothetical protein